MNPAWIPLIQKAGSYVLDRIKGSKKAKITSAAGAATAAATVGADPGGMLFPGSPEYAAVINGVCYLVSAVLLIYREKKGGN